VTLATDWLHAPLAQPDERVRAEAERHQQTLTKPAGSLGRLETTAVQLAGLQGKAHPTMDQVHITVFAGDHGIASEGVSAFPQAVTAQMIDNFIGGGAAICVAARTIGATFDVVNLGTAYAPEKDAILYSYDLGPGTENFLHQAAMRPEQMAAALSAGRDAVQRAEAQGAQLFIAGEMGIANTTSATALACALLNTPPVALAGPGTGLDANGVAHKQAILEQTLATHRPRLDSPEETLRRLGGFEIAAMVGGYVHCAQIGLPALVDGYISTVAALLAECWHPGTSQWMLFSHQSAEPGHRAVLEALDATPLLTLDMRLGEGSGAAVAVPLLRMACALHNDMATFASAGVEEKHP